jgi:hypothetical protein
LRGGKDYPIRIRSSAPATSATRNLTTLRFFGKRSALVRRVLAAFGFPPSGEIIFLTPSGGHPLTDFLISASRKTDYTPHHEPARHPLDSTI